MQYQNIHTAQFIDRPNRRIAHALRAAADAGVCIPAPDCNVTEAGITAGQPVEVRL